MTTMSEKPNRRDFLIWTAGSLAGVGLAPLLAGAGLTPGLAGRRGTGEGATPGPGSSPAPSGGSKRDERPVGDDGLPPRTVGLRSLGGDFVFDPVGLHLEPGGRLVWLNMGDFHTTTAFHPDNGHLLAGDVPLRIPDLAGPWHSGMLGLDAGTEFSHTFQVPGVYDYFCQPHYSFGMVGRIVVTPPDGATPEARPASELNEASRDEIPEVDTILGTPGRAYEWSARINGVLLLRANREAAAGPAGRLAEELAEDRQLTELLERTGEADRALASLERFVEEVRSDAGYETLVSRADDAKAPLSAAASSAD